MERNESGRTGTDDRGKVYLILPEKMEAIAKAFNESALVNMGRMPETKAEADKYFEQAVMNAGLFYQKYYAKDENGKPIHGKWIIKKNLQDYVKEIVGDYMDSLEIVYQQMFHSDD